MPTLLDPAAKQHLRIAAIRATAGRLPRDGVAAVAASPGQVLRPRGDGRQIPLRHSRGPDEAMFRPSLPAPPAEPDRV